MKLKQKDIPDVRGELLGSQDYRCGICKLPLDPDQAVLDHDHVKGYVRGVLHRGCNASEGKILNTLRRYGIKDPKGFLSGLIQYHEEHKTNQTGLVHPLFRTPEERKSRAKKRAKMRLKVKHE